MKIEIIDESTINNYIVIAGKLCYTIHTVKHALTIWRFLKMSNITPLVLMETIVAEGNITAAAEKLYVSQPYLSKMLSRLEGEYGLEFFTRLPRSVQITYAGERYLDHLRRKHEIDLDMLSEFDMISKNKKGKIKLGINPALGSSILPLIIPPFLDKNPEIKFEFYEEDADTIDSLIENHMIDIAFEMAPMENNAFQHHYVYSDQMYLIVPKNNPLYQEKYGSEITHFPYDIEKLDNLPLVLLPHNFGLRRLVDLFYNRKRLKQNVILETSTVYSAVGLTRKGVGATFVPVTGMSWPTFNDCNVFVFDSDIFKCDYVFSHRQDRSLAPTIVEFIRSSTDILRELSPKFTFSTNKD